jgi:hypothetical protein
MPIIRFCRFGTGMWRICLAASSDASISTRLTFMVDQLGGLDSRRRPAWARQADRCPVTKTHGQPGRES